MKMEFLNNLSRPELEKVACDIMKAYDDSFSKELKFNSSAADNILYFYDVNQENYEIKLTFSSKNYVTIESHLDSHSGDDWSELDFLDISYLEEVQELFGKDDEYFWAY